MTTRKTKAAGPAPAAAAAAPAPVPALDQSAAAAPQGETVAADLQAPDATAPVTAVDQSVSTAHQGETVAEDPPVPTAVAEPGVGAWYLDPAPALEPFTPQADINDERIDEFDGPFLSVRSVAQAGRRRAGLAFGPEPTFIPIALLTEEQIAALKADDHLVVQFVED